MNYSELLSIDLNLPTIDTDFALFLKQRSALIEKAIVEKNTSLLEEIMVIDQSNLDQLKACRLQLGDHLVKLSKVIKYDDIS